ncbi:hypothetical protein JCM15415_18440 [Methanobacterium movens]
MNLDLDSLNKKINILAIFTGLFVSFLIPVMGFIIYGDTILSGSGQITPMGYMFFLPSMALLGGLLAALLKSEDFVDGLVNGGFLGLVITIIMGFVGGTLILLFMLFMGNLSTLFATSTTSVQNNINFMRIILQPFLIIWSGMLGGLVGYMVKVPFVR